MLDVINEQGIECEQQYNLTDFTIGGIILECETEMLWVEVGCSLNEFGANGGNNQGVR